MQLTRLEPFFNRLKRQLLSRVILVRVGLIVIGVLAILGLVLFFYKTAPGTIKFVASLASDSLPQHDGRTNFLILGVPGGDHEGADLTDSIIFLSVSHTTGLPTVFLSIPRDIWIPSLRAKINTAYHYGRQKSDSTGGLLLAKSSVSEIIDQPVDFAAVFDFATFSESVDLLGGVDIQVDSAFTDDRYPIDGREQDLCDGDLEFKCRYETISFPAGIQHLDGVTALKFVRSRHSPNPTEGTDFARSRRQTKVLEAIKAKLLSPSSLRHPAVYRQILNLVLKNTVTDIDSSTYPSLLKLAFKAKNNKLISASLSEPDHLYHPPVSKKYDQQWVLVPAMDNPKIITDFVAGLLK